MAQNFNNQKFVKQNADSAEDNPKSAVDPNVYKDLSKLLKPHQKTPHVIKKALIITVASTAILLCLIILTPNLRDQNENKTPQKQVIPQTTKQPPKPENDVKISQKNTQKNEIIQQNENIKPQQPAMSLRLAQTLYANGEFKQAFNAFENLKNNLTNSESDIFLSQYFQVISAICSKNIPGDSRSTQILRQIQNTRCPAVKCLVNYLNTIQAIDNNEFLSAYRKACQTLALIETLENNKSEMAQLAANAQFLAAKSLSCYIFSITDIDTVAPDNLWTKKYITPFINLNEINLRNILNNSDEQIKNALLTPKIKKIEQTENNSPRWSVTASNTPLNELLGRFAANASLDIIWKLDNFSAQEKHLAIKRPVSIYINSVTTEQFLNITAGAAGFVANIQDQNCVYITNPQYSDSLNQQLNLLTKKTFSTWRHFIFNYDTNENIPNAHFAMAMLEQQNDSVDQVIAECKLLANTYPNSSLAPNALLYSSSIKIKIKDYVGAQKDLIQLNELYPDCTIADQAYLQLADITAKIGSVEDAKKLYSRVYNMNINQKFKAIAAFKAGKCSFQKHDFKNAVDWFEKHLKAAKIDNSLKNSDVYYLMGSALVKLNKNEQASNLFMQALDNKLQPENYIKVISALVNACIQHKDFVKALKIIENVEKWQLTQNQLAKIAILENRVLRLIGFPDNAIANLKIHEQYPLMPLIKAKLLYEMALCCENQHNPQMAFQYLAKCLTASQDNSIFPAATLKLAQINFQLEQYEKAKKLCDNIILMQCPSEIKHETADLIAKIYLKQKNFDKAAMALIENSEI